MAIIGLAGWAALHGSTASQPPRLTITAEGDGNSVTVSDEGETVILDVRSRSGIGHATVKIASGALPKKIIVRLHLKGLEEFRLSHDKADVTARVSSSDGSKVHQSLRLPGGDEKDITSTNPLWLSVKTVSGQATPRIPLNQGHFEITLPKDFLREGNRSSSIRWIDFYR